MGERRGQNVSARDCFCIFHGSAKTCNTFVIMKKTMPETMAEAREEKLEYQEMYLVVSA